MEIIRKVQLERMKLKAFLVETIAYATSKEKTPILKTVLMKLIYLIVLNEPDLRIVSFISYNYGPYSPTIENTLKTLIGNYIKYDQRISNNGYVYYLYSSNGLDETLKKYITSEEISKLHKAIDNIYKNYGKDNRLYLDKILEYIYKKDKAYKKTKFGEEIVF